MRNLKDSVAKKEGRQKGGKKLSAPGIPAGRGGGILRRGLEGGLEGVWLI